MTFLQSIEYCRDKYQKFGPNILITAHNSWLESPWKSTLLVSFVAGIICAVLAGTAYFVWNKVGSFPDASEAAKGESASPAFSVREGWTLAHQPPNLWFVGSGSRTPIHYAILITFTNLRPHPILIEGYTIEQKLKDEEWQSVSLPFGTANGKMYLGPLEKAQETNFVTFEDAIRDKNIAPNESIRAWVFLIRPRKGLLRLTIDTPGGSYTQQTQGRGGSSWSAQPMLWAAAPGTAKIDISGIPEDDFSPKPKATPLASPSPTPVVPPSSQSSPESQPSSKVVTPRKDTASESLLSNPKSVAMPDLHNLYLTDFKGMKLSSDKQFKSPDGKVTFSINVQINLDHQSKSKFLSVYVPRSVPDVFKLCASLPELYQVFLADLDSMRADLQIPGDPTVSSSMDMIFTGAIYIYYEEHLTLEQLGSLERLFKTKNLHPHFRGTDYATSMWLAQKASAPTPP